MRIFIDMQLRHDKHISQLPEHLIRQLGWSLGDNLEVHVRGKKLILKKLADK